MRSLLFVPGDSPRKLARAPDSGADALILDLEDSVAPDAKVFSRESVAGFLREAGRGGARKFVRINDLGSGLAEDDLAAVAPLAPAGIVLPKARGQADIERLARMLDICEADAGLAPGAIQILPIATETPAALLAAGTITAHPRLAGVAWGAEDLSAALGARSARDEGGAWTDLFRLARIATLLAASVAGVAAVDTVFTDFRDEAGLRRECLAAERDGFTAKLAIHPGQVAAINEAFTPSLEAVAEARALVAAFQAAGDPGVLALDGRMFDIPHRRRAERLLQRAASATPAFHGQFNTSGAISEP